MTDDHLLRYSDCWYSRRFSLDLLNLGTEGNQIIFPFRNDKTALCQSKFKPRYCAHPIVSAEISNACSRYGSLHRAFS